MDPGEPRCHQHGFCDTLEAKAKTKAAIFRACAIFWSTFMSVSRRCSCYAKPASMEHAMQFLARLVWAMLGATAITTKKLERGLSLVVLGVKLSLCAFGCACRPAEAKAQKCIDAICKALNEEMLHPGAAQKLARRLS